MNHCLGLWDPGSLAEPVIGPAEGRTRWLGPRNDAKNRESHDTSAPAPVVRKGVPREPA